jgi:hypothetical protein
MLERNSSGHIVGASGPSADTLKDLANSLNFTYAYDDYEDVLYTTLFFTSNCMRTGLNIIKIKTILFQKMLMTLDQTNLANSVSF